MTTSLKTCFKCGVERPLTEYYTHKQMADGHLNKCKPCTKKDARDRRYDPTSREKVLTYDRARGSRQSPEYRRARRAERPTSERARAAVGNAVRDGRMNRPDRCEHCKTVTKVHGHHEDYTKPLEVIWLCVPCHRQLHAFYDTIGREIPMRVG